MKDPLDLPRPLLGRILCALRLHRWQVWIRWKSDYSFEVTHELCERCKTERR